SDIPNCEVRVSRDNSLALGATMGFQVYGNSNGVRRLMERVIQRCLMGWCRQSTGLAADGIPTPWSIGWCRRLFSESCIGSSNSPVRSLNMLNTPRCTGRSRCFAGGSRIDITVPPEVCQLFLLFPHAAHTPSPRTFAPVIHWNSADHAW
ncbi:hypothetical protein HAX54_014942, partial [Datura stramonium]|nr:hypothetical protein [Datura stramonium]